MRRKGFDLRSKPFLLRNIVLKRYRKCDLRPLWNSSDNIIIRLVEYVQVCLLNSVTPANVIRVTLLMEVLRLLLWSKSFSNFESVDFAMDKLLFK